MTQRFSWLLLGAAFILVLAAPFILRPVEETWEAEETLSILSPHWDGIRHEFRLGFRDWYYKREGRRVDVEWLDLGGTSDIRKFLDSEFKRIRETGQDGIGVDMVFGGGADFFRGLKKRGYLVPCKLPAQLLQAIPAEVNGVEVYDPELTWYGAAMSGFGLIYNKAVLRYLGRPAPTSWEDLGDPRLLSWVGAGDPGKSGSVHMMFEIILQAYGWEKGMEIIAKMGANARYFSDSGSDIPHDVALGEVAIGMCIDFYAGAKIAEVGDDIVGFCMPAGLTVINPDPVAILKGAPHSKLAQAFVEYVLSRPGQQLWMYPEGAAGGPRKFRLSRLGILRSLYSDPGKIVVNYDPFKERGGFDYDSSKGGKRWLILNDFVRAAIMDTHEEAVMAWNALTRALRTGPLNSAKIARAQKRFAELPVTEKEFMRLAERWRPGAPSCERIRLQWVRWFRKRYHDVALILK